MSDPFPRSTDLDDPQWRALNYVLGELSSEEAEAYELQLDADQQAREAVVRATALISAIYEAGCDVELPRRDRRSVAAVHPAPPASRNWIAPFAAAAACVVAAGMWLALSGGPGGLWRQNFADPADNGAGQLVAIWSEGLPDGASEIAGNEAAATEPELEVAAGRDAEPAFGSEVDAANADSAGESDRVAKEEDSVPGWMVAAISIGQESALGSDSAIREN